MAASLAQLPEVQRISPLIIRVLGGNPGKFTLQGTNTYIVGNGSCRLLIDTGEGRPSWISALQKVLNKENAIISTALITHWHHDHVGGIGHLRELYPMSMIHKHHPDKDQLGIEDGQIFHVQGATVRAIYSPGHTHDHISLVLEEEDAMFTGDNVLGHGTAVFEDLAAYVTSLEKMGSMFSGRAYPGHGPVIEDGKARILEYIRHRRQRENQVLGLLMSLKLAPETADGNVEETGWSSIEIVKEIYKDVPESLHIAANGGIIQVLKKLENEGRVVRSTLSQKWVIGNRFTL